MSGSMLYFGTRNLLSSLFVSFSFLNLNYPFPVGLQKFCFYFFNKIVSLLISGKFYFFSTANYSKIRPFHHFFGNPIGKGSNMYL